MDINKQNQITMLCSLIPESNPRINSLHTIFSLKRETDKVFNEKLKDETGRLKYEILNFIQRKIYNKSSDDLKKFCGIYITDEKGDNHEILSFIMEYSFKVKMDVDGHLIILAGSGFTSSINMEYIKRREIANSLEEVEILIQRINLFLDKIIEIKFIKLEDTNEKFRLEWDLAGLIHEKKFEEIAAV